MFSYHSNQEQHLNQSMIHVLLAVGDCNFILWYHFSVHVYLELLILTKVAHKLVDSPLFRFIAGVN